MLTMAWQNISEYITLNNRLLILKTNFYFMIISNSIKKCKKCLIT